ncbi:hypothetical protein [Helicobacter canis]|uniref:hypothetical protein n=1 Tax=Helicobacter canis TaxID=29419 RepID=UPI001479783B|nr:hypothetical protein [Helicobacter canis]
MQSIRASTAPHPKGALDSKDFKQLLGRIHTFTTPKHYNQGSKWQVTARFLSLSPPTM